VSITNCNNSISNSLNSNSSQTLNIEDWIIPSRQNTLSLVLPNSNEASYESVLKANNENSEQTQYSNNLQHNSNNEG
jgi:hypothetical protein